MATLIPSSPYVRTAGEQMVINHFKKHLNDLWYLYYEPVINGVQPDLLLFHEAYGIVIFEIKDLVTQNILQITPDTWTIVIGEQQTRITSPFKQAARYRDILYGHLSSIPDLIQTEGRYRGRLKIPIAFATFFTKISRDEAKKIGFNRLIPESQLWTSDDLQSESDIEKKVRHLFSTLFTIEPLTEMEAKKVRDAIYPVIQSENVIRENSLAEKKNIKGFPTNKSIHFYLFNNVLEEISFVVDSLLDHVHRSKTSAEIVIAYHQDRPLIHGSLLQLIKKRLNRKNLHWSHGEHAEVVTIKPLKQLLLTPRHYKTIYIVDVNMIRDPKTKDQFRAILYDVNRYDRLCITANGRSLLTEWINTMINRT